MASIWKSQVAPFSSFLDSQDFWWDSNSLDIFRRWIRGVALNMLGHIVLKLSCARSSANLTSDLGVKVAEIQTRLRFFADASMVQIWTSRRSRSYRVRKFENWPVSPFRLRWKLLEDTGVFVSGEAINANTVCEWKCTRLAAVGGGQ